LTFAAGTLRSVPSFQITSDGEMRPALARHFKSAADTGPYSLPSMERKNLGDFGSLEWDKAFTFSAHSNSYPVYETRDNGA